MLLTTKATKTAKEGKSGETYQKPGMDWELFLRVLRALRGEKGF